MKTVFLLCVCFISINISFSQNLQWRLLPGSPGTSGMGRFEDMYFINENTGWIINYDAEVYRTTNGGDSWSLIFTATFGNQLRSVGFFDSNNGIIGTLINDTNRILYKTTNGGNNWTAVTSISGRRPRGICGISIVNSNVAYACGRYSTPARIIKTTDKGNTWSTIFNDSSLARSLVDCYFWSPDSGIAVGGYTTSTYDNGSAVVIKTTDGGATWQRVHKTTRTSEWCWKISFVSREIGFVSVERFAGMAYILKTTNNGNNWIEIPFMSYDEEGIGFVNENTGWIGGWGGPTYRTTNGGANWALAGFGYYMNRFRFLSDTLAYGVGDRVYKYSKGLVGVNLSTTEIPSSYSLHQNFPNPFNPSTKISFDLSGPSQNVSLIVYDAVGKKIDLLVNEKLSEGQYEVEFNADDLASGIYFYELSLVSADGAINFTKVKKMMLIR